MCKGYTGFFFTGVTNRHNGNSGLYQAYFIRRRRWDIPIACIARNCLALIACFFLFIYAGRIFESFPQIVRLSSIDDTHSPRQLVTLVFGIVSWSTVQLPVHIEFIFNVIPIWRWTAARSCIRCLATLIQRPCCFIKHSVSLVASCAEIPRVTQTLKRIFV